jgi:hypothetical protein
MPSPVVLTMRPRCCDLRIDELAAMRFEAFERSFLVGAHQPRIAGHIGGENGGQLAFDGLLHSLPQHRRS